MTQDFYRQQLTRLRVRFGEKAMDAEFVMLVWREVHDMSESAFQRFCDVLIGSRTHHKPPLLSEFREARMQEQKIKFDNDVRGAVNFLERKAPAEMHKHLRAILSKEFGGVESVMDAVDVARHRLRMERADKGDPA